MDIKGGNRIIMKTKKQRAIGYLSVTGLLLFLAGIFGGTALKSPHDEWLLLFILGFAIIIFRVMFLIVEIDLFYTRNFDNKPVIPVEKEFKERLLKTIKLMAGGKKDDTPDK